MATLRDRWHDFLAVPPSAERDTFRRQLRARHPRFIEAVVADAQMTARNRGERDEYRSRLDTALQVLRLMVVTDAFLGQVLYRAKAALQAHRVPLLPRLLHLMAISQAQICIGDPVTVHPGVYFPHGQVVIDGITEIHSRVMIAPFTTIGLAAGAFDGPTLRTGVRVGTGARVLGSVTVGEWSEIGANAVVVDDVVDGVVVAGIPARVLRPKSPS